MRRAFFCLVWLAPLLAWGHVGSPNVYFEGKIGPYPTRVVIRPPGVVPGLAEITIRPLGSAKIDRVTALPVFWETGRKGAPPPDVAEPVRGEPGLYNASLWFMKPGAYTVEIAMEGAEGQGTTLVPVNAVATTRKTMPAWFAGMLLFLGALLFTSAVKLAGAAFGESLLPPGVELSRNIRWRSRFAMGAGAIGFSLLLAFGKAWWEQEDTDYRNNRLYKPTPITADVRLEKEQPVLRLEIQDSPREPWIPLIPDHGKLMHVFMVSHQAGVQSSGTAFAHLHPAPRGDKHFEVALPPLPVGRYNVYADVTHESGVAQTLTGTIDMPMLPASLNLSQPSWTNAMRDVVCSSTNWVLTAANLPLRPDPDDTWHFDPASGAPPLALENNQIARAAANSLTLVWEKSAPLRMNQETSLRFKLLGASGDALALEPYMGMAGHAAIRHTDGSVFAHLHPVGTFSMAAQHFYLNREQSNPGESHVATNQADLKVVSFPYEFPKAGRYTIWVQLKSSGRVYTAAFPVEVAAGAE